MGFIVVFFFPGAAFCFSLWLALDGSFCRGWLLFISFVFLIAGRLIVVLTCSLIVPAYTFFLENFQVLGSCWAIM